MDSGWQETSSNDIGTDEEEEDDKEVEVITATPLLFPQPALSATAHLIPMGTHNAHIPGFGPLS